MGICRFIQRKKGKSVQSGVFKKKIGGDGLIERVQSSPYCKGFFIDQSFDFNETFASVACLAIICIFVAFAAVCGWSVEQMDVIAAYLHNKLEEQDIYMTLLEGLVVLGYEQEQGSSFIENIIWLEVVKPWMEQRFGLFFFVALG